MFVLSDLIRFFSDKIWVLFYNKLLAMIQVIARKNISIFTLKVPSGHRDWKVYLLKIVYIRTCYHRNMLNIV